MTILDYNRLDERCTACCACEAICNNEAIRMIQDSEGFFYPIINQKLCSNCGRCYEVCPLREKPYVQELKEILYGYTKSEYNRLHSSSGGVFPEMAQFILREGGSVFGVAFDEDSQSASYCCSDHTPIEKIYRSKYVEASDNNSFYIVKQHLQSGKKVVYCGTPCKIKGLINYLGKDYPNLISVDFMCHGKPSSLLLSDVIRDEEKKANNRCAEVTFREKKNGWRNQSIVFYYQDQTSSIYESGHYYYYFYFLNNYSIRKSCVNCMFYKNHISDITLADHWGISKKEDDDKGCSLIMVNTYKGKMFLDSIGDNLTLISDQKAFGNIEVYAHTTRRGYSMRKRNRFYRIYKKKGIKYISGKGFERTRLFNKRKQACISLLSTIKHHLI